MQNLWWHYHHVKVNMYASRMELKKCYYINIILSKEEICMDTQRQG